MTEIVQAVSGGLWCDIAFRLCTVLNGRGERERERGGRARNNSVQSVCAIVVKKETVSEGASAALDNTSRKTKQRSGVFKGLALNPTRPDDAPVPSLCILKRAQRRETFPVVRAQKKSYAASWDLYVSGVAMYKNQMSVVATFYVVFFFLSLSFDSFNSTSSCFGIVHM